MTRSDQVVMTRAVVLWIGGILLTASIAVSPDCSVAHADLSPEATGFGMARVEAVDGVLPADQWTPRAHIWLARAFVAEAGWEAERDHAAIAHVLARRWRRAVNRWPTIRFVDVIRAYCAGLGDSSRSTTPRQRWVRDLGFGLEQPEDWNPKASWGKHVGHWRAAIDRAAAWQLGMVSDPCNGRAWHWGGAMDSPTGRMEPIDCGETRNRFYGLRRGE